MNETCNDRNALFRKIHECEFMMIDLGLYLDTHPDCVQALNAFQKHRSSYKKECFSLGLRPVGYPVQDLWKSS